MTTTQPWEIEFDSTFNGLYDPIVRESIRIKSFITSTRLSAYKEGQRDMRELIEEKYVVGVREGDAFKECSIDDLISEIGKGRVFRR